MAGGAGLVYVRHALRRIEERGISQEEVERVVLESRLILPGTGGGPKRRRYVHEVGGRRISVVLDLPNIVITAYVI